MASFKQLITLGTACASLLMASGASAQTPQRPHFYPAKTWDVHSLQTVSDYGGECIIQAEFNNGFILQLNGSSNWVQQLNLNIRQAAFDVGKNYDVGLVVPGSVKEVVNGTSNRGNIISMPMKGKKALYKAMRENAVLDIDIEDNKFRFFLTGFGTATKKFDECMAGGAPGRIAATNPRSPNNLSVRSSNLSVSTESMSDAEKDFMVNESIAYEQQEQNTAISGTSTSIPAVPPPVRNAEIFDKAKADVARREKRSNLEFSTHRRLSEQLAAEMEATYIEEPVAKAPMDNFKQAPVFPPIKPAPAPVAAVERKPLEMPKTNVVSLEEIIEQVPVETLESDIETPEVFIEPEAGMTPDPITMPASDIAAGLLAEEESSIDMPKIKVHKTVARGSADFRQPKIENANAAALARVVTLEKELQAAQVTNSSLNDELKTSLEEGQKEQISVASENWNLERVTMRYNEAERQLKSMGRQLQKERAQHAMERKELETMLFDPEVASQEQLARLSKLERELEDAQAELKKSRTTQ